MIYESQVMKDLMQKAYRIAHYRSRVLILGEHGTGKETIAKEIHDKSLVSSKPFITVDCGVLRETLLDSELFGHEKGAFTGALSRKIGLLEVAAGGTLYLKNVDELTAGLQAKLLSSISTGTMYRVGGRDPISVLDVRLISGSSKELDNLVARGEFREDLYHRLNTLELKVPPLRGRREDIIPLIDHFKGGFQTYTAETMNFLVRYAWPGNVRELIDMCSTLTYVAGDRVEVIDLPVNIRSYYEKETDESYYCNLTLHELEKRHVLKALKYFKGNKTKAANALGITIKTIYNKLHEYGEFDNFRGSEHE